MHFTNKIVKIRQDLGKVAVEAEADVAPFPRPTLAHFNEVSMLSLERIMKQLRSTSCSLDCIPAWFLKES